MTDTELMELFLQKYFMNRKTGGNFKIKQNMLDFEINDFEIQRIELMLHDQEVIKGTIVTRADGFRHFICGKILPKGISIVEQQSLDGIIPQLQTINITDSSNIQIGDQNIMNITNQIEIIREKLYEKIEAFDEPEEKKIIAKDLVKKVISFSGKLGRDILLSIFTNIVSNKVTLDSIITTLQMIIPK